MPTFIQITFNVILLILCSELVTASLNKLKIYDGRVGIVHCLLFDIYQVVCVCTGVDCMEIAQEVLSDCLSCISSGVELQIKLGEIESLF